MAKKMSMAQWEKSAADKKMDAKKGIKEGSAKDKKLDKAGLAKVNKGRK